MSTKLAYLAQGRLFYRNGDSSQLIESQFGQEVINRALQRQAKQEWKTGGGSPTALYGRQSLWGTGSDDPKAIKVRITAVAPGKSDDELVYVVSTESVGGVFTYNLSTKKETRLFHKENLYLSDFSRHAGEDLVACCKRYSNGTAGIALWKGNDVQEVTEGDSVDEAPSWVPGGGKCLVYQCAGVARNGEGMMVGVGPVSVQKLDLESGSLTTLLEDESCDFLCPRQDDRGNLFYIKRPYEAPFKRAYPTHKLLLDIVLFPFRLCRAIFHFLDVFSMVFSKKPLTTASGPKMEGPDEKMLFLRGRIIDAEKSLQKKEQTDEPPSLVPKTWQLACRSSSGEEKTLVDGVLSYDFQPDGSIIYTSGTGVYQINADGSGRKMLFRDNIVDTLVILS